MKTAALILTLLVSTGSYTFAHEGHDQAPGSIKSMHGGIPKSGKLFNLEMLAADSKIQFFPMAHKGESLDLSKIVLKGTSKSPKGKPQELKFTLKDKAFVTDIDFQGSHRTNLEIKAEYQGNTDTFKFLVEK